MFIQRAIITRPAAQALQWVDALNAQGLHAQSFPLIDIASALSVAQRAQLQVHAAHFDVCMWVSSNAVEQFYQSNTSVVQAFYAQTAIKLIVNSRQRHWATGPGTVAALLRQGMTSQHIDAPSPQAAQWDSDALWQRVKEQIQPGTKVLIVRGIDIGTPSASRDWLAQQSQNAGGVVEFAAVYERRAPQFSTAQVAWAQTAATDGSVWVFSSSQALTHLPHLPDAGPGWSQARCIVTHERIAQAARAKGFAVVCASRPSVDDLAQSIKSLL